ncbi:hypothetical protein ACOSQ2_010548 [Xanthoceras sorbifolium]
MRFKKAEFWVQVYNVPLVCMTKGIGTFLGNKIGEFCEIDVGATGDCLGKYLRVRVKIDITKPLQRCLKIDLGEKDEILLLLRECVGANKQKEEVEQSYGSWLCASSPTKARPVWYERPSREEGNKICDCSMYCLPRWMEQKEEKKNVVSSVGSSS